MPRPYLDTRHLRVHQFRRLYKLRTSFSEPHWRSKPERSVVLGGLVLELDNLIVQGFSGYARSQIWQAQKNGTYPLTRGGLCNADEYDLLVAAAMSKAATKPGQKPKAVKAPKGPRAIREPQELSNVLRYVLGAVPPEFQNAISLNYAVFQELKYFRHFYAHRCEDTLLKAVNNTPVFASTAYNHPDSYIESVRVGRNAPTYLEWWSEVADFFSVAL